MKYGFRIPSLTKRIAARTSVKRITPNSLFDLNIFLYNSVNVSGELF